MGSWGKVLIRQLHIAEIQPGWHSWKTHAPTIVSLNPHTPRPWSWFSKVSHGVSFYLSKGEDTINSSVSVKVKLIPVVAVFPLSVSATEGKAYIL
jgi:hypothetical protein